MSGTKITKETIVVSNVEIYCEHVLNGKPPIFLIHGFLSSTYTFNKVIPLLAENFSVVAIDLPGFGRSEKADSFHYSFTSFAQLVVGCMEYFGIEKATLVGHSMGGQVALNVARMTPERVNKLVLLCSSGYMKRANKLLVYSTYFPFFNLFAYRYVNRKGVRETLKNVLYDHSLITDEMISEFKRPLSEKPFYKSLIRLVRHREGDLSSAELSSINTPALLIWGEEDRVVPVNVGRKLVKDLPNAKLITYKEAGHLITEERPQEVYSQILSFV
ncbi:alpha/beta hydrolase [Halalkalibacillus sediminis]|uniref:Alpha/beta hydrolase n=1 Tax=Halalkalibacillus sediminis TaxID=2018042 RepID=A0A2I0QQZ7_9BACI|nr:alpha/beta hydrolase [Halalkalibacillus sediminis]PKR76748.1 alpha/beta hydrolase [Halalkalibacillus sediminis]